MATPPLNIENAAESTVQTASDPSQQNETQQETTNIINLPLGKHLSDVAAIAIAKARRVRWIVLAGPQRSGKTTILTSLYELFQLGSVPNQQFAGSETLPGFEERCFLSRTTSDNDEPDTNRTAYEDANPQYLHLRLATTAAPRSFTDLLITDVSGEMFEQVCNSTSFCKELTFLLRASNFVLLLDSKRAIRPGQCWAMVTEAKTLLQSLLDSEMLAHDCSVTVAWSRFDYFVRAGNTTDHKKFRDSVESEFRKEFGRRVQNLLFEETAARPREAPDLKFAFGVLTLLKQWLANDQDTTPMQLLPEIVGVREIDQFASRHFKDERAR